MGENDRIDEVHQRLLLEQAEDDAERRAVTQEQEIRLRTADHLKIESPASRPFAPVQRFLWALNLKRRSKHK
jgi:hypothetical protein